MGSCDCSFSLVSTNSQALVLSYKTIPWISPLHDSCWLTGPLLVCHTYYTNWISRFVKQRKLAKLPNDGLLYSLASSWNLFLQLQPGSRTGVLRWSGPGCANIGAERTARTGTFFGRFESASRSSLEEKGGRRRRSIILLWNAFCSFPSFLFEKCQSRVPL